MPSVSTGFAPHWFTSVMTASPGTPGFEAEFGGGFFDPWGGAPWHGQGYAFERAFDGPAYERTFYLTNLANGIKIHNVYMTFGGTSWGWLPAPVVYTSYDYGAAIDEGRGLTSKLVPMKLIGLMLETVPDLTGFAAANQLVGKNGDEVREALGDKFPKHIYHSIVCIGALIAHWELDHWARG